MKQILLIHISKCFKLFGHQLDLKTALIRDLRLKYTFILRVASQSVSISLLDQRVKVKRIPKKSHTLLLLCQSACVLPLTFVNIWCCHGNILLPWKYISYNININTVWTMCPWHSRKLVVQEWYSPKTVSVYWNLWN